jgi:ferritin-like metal-binding protein YciE
LIKKIIMHQKTNSETRSKAATGTASSNDTQSMLEELFIGQLKDIYWAEKYLTKALPKMKKSVTSEELKKAFEGHLAVTEEHISRLEEVFELMEEEPSAKKCDGMEGLIKEGESVIEETQEGTATRDAGIIIAAQKVEHYEIAAYGSLVQLAKTIGKEDVAGVLQVTLNEEKEADGLLTNLALSSINVSAAQENEDQNRLGTTTGRKKR